MLVVSLGYDTVAGDPHGSWGFEPDIFTEIGRLLAASGLPICVIQEGGYALDDPGRLQPRLRHRTPGGACGMSEPRAFRGRLDRIDDQIAHLLGERFDICREVAHLQERARHPDDAARPRRRGAGALPRARRRGRPAAEFSAELFELLIAATCKEEDELMAARAAAAESEGVR